MKIKKWHVSVLSDNPIKQIKDAHFTTADNDSVIRLYLTDLKLEIDEVTFTLFNKDDESLISKKGDWQNKIASFYLAPEIIQHKGKWIFQVIFHGEKDYVSRPIPFTVEEYLLDNHPPKLEVIENWDKLVSQAEYLINDLEGVKDESGELITELKGYNNEGELLISRLLEAVREENKRKDNEMNRITKEETRVYNETTRQSNELIRESKESERSTNESNRIINENSRQSNEEDRLLEEEARKSSESLRNDIESSRISNENTRIANENERKSNENSRKSAESNRVSAENARVSAENTRQRTLGPRMSSVENLVAGLNSWEVETGSNSRGDWIKFYDGVMIAWYGSTTKDYDVTTAWGSLYYSGYESWTYPVPFIQSPRVIAEYNKFQGDAWVIRGGERKTNTNSGQFYLVRPASGTVSGNIDYIAIGRWK